MKKVLDLLEQHVQWLAIGLGAAFVLAMVWYYIITPPAVVTVGKDTFAPGDVDRHIFEGPVAHLDEQIHGGGKIDLPKPDWLTGFQNTMSFASDQPLVLNHPWINSPALPATALNKMNEPGDLPIVEKVAQIPDVPAATMGGWIAGESSVTNPGDAATPIDKNWVAIAYSIPNREQADAFAAVKLPAFLYAIEVLDVKLYRQQEITPGQWGNETLVHRLPFEHLLPFPADTAQKTEKAAYENWASDNQKPILQPDFYTVAAGDAFTPPSPVPNVEPKAAIAQGLPNFDPNEWKYSAEQWKQMTPEQYKLAQAALKKHNDEERDKAKQKNKGSSGGHKSGRGGGGPSGAHSGDDADRPQGNPPDAVPNPYDVVAMRQSRGPADPPEPGERPTQPAPAQPAAAPADPSQPGAAPTTQPDLHPCPTGKYDPNVAPPSWVGWAIDDTVEQGKIYRYRVVYSIKNPLWDRPNACVNPEMAQHLAAPSDIAKTAWSQPVKVPSRTTFYIAQSLSKNSPTVSFEVFATVGGAKKRHEFTVAPGDMIGAPAEDVNFATDSTLVDVALDLHTQKYYALIADAAGNVSRHDFDTDHDNPDRQADINASNRSSASAAPAAGAMPPEPR